MCELQNVYCVKRILCFSFFLCLIIFISAHSKYFVFYNYCTCHAKDLQNGQHIHPPYFRYIMNSVTLCTMQIPVFNAESVINFQQTTERSIALIAKLHKSDIKECVCVCDVFSNMSAAAVIIMIMIMIIIIITTIIITTTTTSTTIAFCFVHYF
jgi:hypothetical protein